MRRVITKGLRAMKRATWDNDLGRVEKRRGPFPGAPRARVVDRALLRLTDEKLDPPTFRIYMAKKRQPPPPPAPGKNRVRELRMVKASELLPNPKNWRTHPDDQRAAIKAILKEIGYADALLARELEDGRLELIDGHCRAEETAPDELVPVLVLDVNEAEADKLLALLDPLAGLAGADVEALAALYESIEWESPELQTALDDLAEQHGIELEEPEPAGGAAEPTPIPDVYKIIVECPSEAKQKELLARLCEEGWQCRALVL